MKVVVAFAPSCCIKVKAKIWCTHRCGAAHRSLPKVGTNEPLKVGVGYPFINVLGGTIFVWRKFDLVLQKSSSDLIGTKGIVLKGGGILDD